MRSHEAPDEAFDAGRLAASNVGVWLDSYLCRPPLPSSLGRVLMASLRDVVRRPAGATFRIRLSAMSGGWLTQHEAEHNKHRTDA
jgi:hypothetical protein